MNVSSCQRRGLRLFHALMVFAVTFPAHPQALRWTQREGYRESTLSVGTNGQAGFTLLKPEQTGVFFTNAIVYARAEANQNLINGSGVTAGDFDGDGLCDLYFANTDGPNGLFRNQGQWRFQNVTDAAGVGCGTNSASKGVVFEDVNGDGRLDLLVGMLSGPNAFFLNQGQGRFTNMTARAGLSTKLGTHSLAMADVDGDGDLDLYVTNYGELSILRNGGSISTRMVNGKPQVSGRWAKRLKIINGRMIEMGEPDTLHLNNGNGTFSPVSWTGGAFLDEDGQPLKSEPYDMGLSVMFRDMNGDGAPDIYVCNDFQMPDRIWMNDGKGRFRALPDLALRATSHFSMGVDFADIDRDGLDDFFVGDMLSRHHRLRMTQNGGTNPSPAEVGGLWDRHQIRQNALSLNRGDGTYANVACFAGVEASDWTWSVVFLDVDLDGFEDLLVVNAHGYDSQNFDMHERMPQEAGGGLRIGKRLKDFPPLITPNYLFRNRGNRTFEESGAAWGFNSTNVSHGIALADLDLDGDLDVVVSCIWQAPLIYRNESAAPRVAVRLRGAGQNTRGIGAKIKLLGGIVPMQSQEMQSGGRYLSSDDAMRVFAAGSLTNEMTLEVTWRSGRRSVIHGVRANHIYEVDEAAAGPVAAATSATPAVAPLFQDVSGSLGHTNFGNPFNDFERQPLLPRSLARLGPGVAWMDLDGDGRDELVIGESAGASLVIYGSDGRGQFKRWTTPATDLPLAADLSGLASWVPAPGRRALLAGQSALRTPDADVSPLNQIELKPSSPMSAVTMKTVSEIPAAKSATGPIAVADVEGDGDLDVFLGGRAIPAHYPEAASSQLFLNEGGTLKAEAASGGLLKNVGLVSGAVFSDLNGDGFPELILACEWGPVRIFRNTSGRFSEWDAPVKPAVEAAPVTLRQLTGWWTSVTAGDLDGDGRMDLIVGNWGLNSSYGSPSLRQPVRMFFGDFDGTGSVDLLEAENEEGTGRLVPRRDMALLATGWPELRTRFATHQLFSKADISEVLGGEKARAKPIEASLLASAVLLNRGDRFEAVRLPEAAQYAPAFGLNIADFNGDGAEDLFVSQNFFSNRMEEPRQDAGRGLLLLGDGRGTLVAMRGQESGVKLYGEQRGSAVADFDEDGRPDLAVTQSGGATHLLRNATAKPGLRVRLIGSPGNPDGIGASVALRFGAKSGPAREIHGGAGYWSQDSVVVVLGLPAPATEIQVRWPGGKTTSSAVPAGAKEISVALDGAVKKVK